MRICPRGREDYSLERRALAGDNSLIVGGGAQTGISVSALPFFKMSVTNERVCVLLITSPGSGERDADASKVALGQKAHPACRVRLQQPVSRSGLF